MFSSVFSSGSITITGFLICLGCALILGLLSSLVYTYKTIYTKGFLIMLALIPAIVCVVIMMVSGNLGASVAVAGTFSLVRFRSNPGTAKEIGSVFLASAIGLSCGIGYPLFACLFTLLVCGVELLYEKIDFGSSKWNECKKLLQITVPEDLNYTGMFDDLFEKYTMESKLLRVKTTNLGSLNRLTYDIVLKDSKLEKEFIDELRTRNGNLEICISIPTIENAL